MAVEVEYETRNTEAEQILNWRRDELVRAGYEASAAEFLSELRHVDLHVAVGLLGRGCPPDTALEILV